MRLWLRRELNGSHTSGLHSPSSPPEGADALGVCLHYLIYYRNDYERSRMVVKTKAKRVVLWTAVVNGVIAVLGTAVAVFRAPWLGLLSTGLAASVGVIAAWDGLYRHRELWVQRSVILGQLQTLLRTIELRKAQDEDRDTLAREAMVHLNAILEDDLEAWTSLRRTQPAVRENTSASSK